MALDDFDDDIDVADAVDTDLFPIFEEEAAELLPLLGGALRDWSQHPDNTASRSSALRTLHTLKGGARLAGAMRMGERAHRMESEIEAIGSEGADQRSIEQLLARFDALQATFDGLRAADDAIQTELVKRAVVAPPEQKVVEEAAAAEPTVVETVAAVPGGALCCRNTRPVRAHAVACGVDPGGPRPRPSARSPGRPGRRGQHHAVAHRSRAVGQIRSLWDLTENLERLRGQLRDIELQGEVQMTSRLEAAKAASQAFDPLEFDRFTRFQELTRMMAESVNDVATVQRTLQTLAREPPKTSWSPRRA